MGHGMHATFSSERQEDALDRIADQLELANKMWCGLLVIGGTAMVTTVVTAIWVVTHIH